MSKTIKIRQARQTDAVAIYRLLEQMVSEDDIPYPPVQTDRLMAWVVSTIAQAETVVAELSGRIVGSFSVAPAQYPWSEEWVLQGRWFYVLPQFRKQGTGTKLIDIVVASADRRKAPLALSTMGGEWQEEFLANDYEFVYGGGMFFREVPHDKER